MYRLLSRVVSVVGVGTRLIAGRRMNRVSSRDTAKRLFSSPKLSRPVLGPTPRSVGMCGCSPGTKWPPLKPDHTPLSGLWLRCAELHLTSPPPPPPSLYMPSWRAKRQLPNLTFRGPCIVTYSYNKNKRDALFLKLILV